MVLYITFMPSICRILINNKIFKSFSRSVCFQVKLGCYPCEHAASFTDGPKGWEKRWGRWGVREVMIIEKCPDIQYTHFSYDEYGGFDVKIVAQNHTFFAHRWDQIRSFLSMWSSCNTQLKNYSQLCRWAKIWRITNMSTKWCQKI